MYHVGAREYDPRTARWLQRDPIDAASGDPNLYRYCGNDPVNQVDPDGTDCDYRRVLDLAGFIPGIGDVADAINAIGYALEGDWVNAGISAASVVGADWLKAGRLAKRVVQEVVEEGAEQVAKREAKNALQEQGKKQASNSRKEFRKAREEYWKREAQENPDKYSPEDLERMRQGKAPIRDGEPVHLHHKKPLSEGGPNCPENLEPMTGKQHRERHKQQGDFSRWGKRGLEERRKRR
ncbi:MAG: hypothetical protein KatS3mg022_0431 [Armatimonadota bacterium]|nr:MAG: hypothetical protein KatS3mg022_0431 [Armatimonadota bacterium]